MLLKTFKYDFKSIFKLWMIASITCIANGGICGLGLRLEKIVAESDAIQFGGLSVILIGIACFSFIVICAMFPLTVVMLTVRAYTNMFTDEGYLTFTLPISRKDILKSKILNIFVYTTLTIGVIGASLVILTSIAPPDLMYYEPYRNMLEGIVYEVVSTHKFIYGGSLPIETFLLVLVEILMFAIILLAIYIIPTLVLMCLTIGATVVKRGKVPVGIAIFYGLFMAFEMFFVASFLGILLFESNALSIGTTVTTPAEGFLLLLILMCIIFAAMVCFLGFMFSKMHECLKKKLNLA